MKIIAVMPAYNEEKTVGGIVKRTKKYVDSVIVIDDCSKDNTSKNAKKAGAIVIRHPKNKGLGGALRTGFSEALKRKADVIITIDADGQHVPEEIPKFIEKINEGYDFVLGERDLKGYPFFKKFGNFFLNIATNFISGTALHDTESGFRAFKTSALKKMYLKAERYEIAVEIVFESGRNYLKSTNVPIRIPIYVKGVGFMDGIKNFIFLLHRRERKWIDYLHDAKYVVKKWI